MENDCLNCKPMTLVQEMSKTVAKLEQKNDEQGRRVGSVEKTCERQEAGLEGVNTSVERYNEAMLEVSNNIGDIRERLAKAEDKLGSAHHRIDTMEKQTEAIIRMSVSVEKLAEKVEESNTLIKEQDNKNTILMKGMTDTIAELDTRLTTRITEIENKPAKLALKSYQFMLGIFATVAFTAIATVIVSKYIHP